MRLLLFYDDNNICGCRQTANLKAHIHSSTNHPNRASTSSHSLTISASLSLSLSSCLSLNECFIQCETRCNFSKETMSFLVRMHLLLHYHHIVSYRIVSFPLHNKMMCTIREKARNARESLLSSDREHSQCA